jgi:alkylation response protein AidB-like acyl-CoA dehydrogenase
MDPVVIAGMARTPMGGFMGALSRIPEPELGAVAISAALSGAGASRDWVDQVVMGNMLPAGLGQAPARQAALGADLPLSVRCKTVGMARAALDAAVAYAKDRERLGRKIIDHQAVSFRLADMATKIVVARQLVLHAASMAKLIASEMAERVCSDAIQTFGGYGYTRDFPMERIYRDVRVCQIYEGTSDVQRLVIVRGLAD